MTSDTYQLEPVYQSSELVELESVVDDALREALRAWEDRDDRSTPGTEHFQVEDCAAFALTREGELLDGWPDEKVVQLPEALAREFLFPNGICSVRDEEPRVYRVSFRMQTLDSQEYLLVAGYGGGEGGADDGGKVAGIVVVCLTRYRSVHRIAASASES